MNDFVPASRARFAVRACAALAVALTALSISASPAVPSVSTADLWIDTDGGSCERQAPAGSYTDGDACPTLQDAWNNAQSGDIVGIQPGTYASQDLESIWPATDSSSNDNRGWAYGADPVADGQVDNALQFNGDGDQVDLPSLGTFYDSAFTLEAWTKKSTAKKDATIVGSWSGAANGGPALWIDHIDGEYELTLGTGMSNYLDSGVTPEVGVWHHIAGTYDGSTARLYIDGVQVASKSFTSNVGDSDEFRIGALESDPTAFFDGLIDEVRIYDRALSQSEVEDDMGGASPGTGLVAAYGFDDLDASKAVRFEAASGRPSFGEIQVAATNVTFRGIEIENRGGHAGPCGNAVATLFACGQNATFDDVVVDGLDATNLHHGVRAASTATGFVLRNSEILNVVDAKGFEGGADDMVIEHNLWHDITLVTPGVHNECMYADGGNRAVIRGNRFVGCPTMSLFFTNYHNGPTYDDVLIENNVFGHTLDVSQNFHASCTFVIGAGFDQQNEVNGWVIRFNTFETCVDFDPNGTPSTGDDNGSALFYGNLGGHGNCDLPEWTYSYNVGDTCEGTGEVEATPGTNAANDQDRVPWYVDAPNGDFHLDPGSVPIGAGHPTLYPATDIEGTSRDSEPDAGAYEFVEVVNLWVDTDGGTCTRTASYVDADACTPSDAYDEAETDETIIVHDGSYGSWETPSGTKAVTYAGESGAMPAFGEVTVNFDNVTFSNLEFLRVDTEAGEPEGLTFEDFVIDGQGGDDGHALRGGSGGHHTFLRGTIGNVTDRMGVQYSGEGHLFDDVVFEDVVMSEEGELLGAGNMCFYAIVTPGLTIRNSIFRNCTTVDLFFTYGGWWDPLPDPYGDVTLENNVFGHTRFVDGADWHYNSLVVADTGDSDLDGWTVRNNTFETTAIVAADTATDSRWVGNLGDWDCVSGMTYRHNVGWSCGGTGDTSVSPASSGGPPSSQSVFYAGFDWVDPASDDFHLLSTSDAIGEADATDAPATDRDGNPRDSSPDAGAYEYIAEP